MGRPAQANATTKQTLLMYELETEHGSSRFTTTARPGSEEYERELTNTLHRLTGCQDRVWGHYGTFNDHGGLDVLGQFAVKEIRDGQ
ncbi:MAG TPA: hypothetical protein PKK23_15815 [Nitrospirales bacterium]|nr:hypothetical protein [Nitrospiraceae bacterium]HNP30513.1 hypothetical protein [Nitrospirales bacterium]